MATEKIQSDVVVIGAGVIGLAIADKLAVNHSVVLLESHTKFGQETSSRNSEVIHSGIHYPLESKKTEWCIEGRNLLYDFCKHYHVPYSQSGKLVVATDSIECEYLENLSAHCKIAGVPCEELPSEGVAKKEPWVRAERALFFPLSGIIDSHSYMAALERFFIESEGTLAYQHQVCEIQSNNDSWVVSAKSPSGYVELQCNWVVNAAGLAAAELSNKALKTNRYQHRFCRGRYFGLSNKYLNKFSHLIYPVPSKDGLGIHVTIDLAGNARLGPDTDWCDDDETFESVATLYNCDWETLVYEFSKKANRYCSIIESSHLTPSMVGIRPKLFIRGKASPDFLVENHHGFIHCLGIESPGLTASQAISKEVARLVT